MYNNSSTNNLNTTYFGVAWVKLIVVKLSEKRRKNILMFSQQKENLKSGKKQFSKRDLQ
jgi:hypothetical protein